jgi:hypothetical protein
VASTKFEMIPFSACSPIEYLLCLVNHTKISIPNIFPASGVIIEVIFRVALTSKISYQSEMSRFSL